MKFFSFLMASSIWIPSCVKCKEVYFTSCSAWCWLKKSVQNAALRESGLQSFSFLVGARFHLKYSHFPHLQTKKCSLTKSCQASAGLQCRSPSASNLGSLKHCCWLPSTPWICWRAPTPLQGEGASPLFLGCKRLGGCGSSVREPVLEVS